MILRFLLTQTPNCNVTTDVHTPLQISPVPISVIYTSAKDIDTIQRNLSRHLKQFIAMVRRKIIITISLKKAYKNETMIFGTAKIINLKGKELIISVIILQVPEGAYMKAASRGNLLRLIHQSIDQKYAETIYNTMILPILTYCGSLGLGWSDIRKSLIKNINNEFLISLGTVI